MSPRTLPLPGGRSLPVTGVHTLVIGSGAAGLNAAVQLHERGVRDLLVVTEGLEGGTSINTGSDKQTYYKLSLCGADDDSPRRMAGTYYRGGGMHGDLALVEAAVSARAFLNLVGLGVPFPQDSYGQFVGYKTDHDPLRRATSIGPYTSREMCRALIRRVERLGLPVRERAEAVALLTVPEGGGRRRAAGALVADEAGALSAVQAENVVFAVGGPGGLYKASVYPGVHTGAIGLALRAGARARNLPESQFGLASTRFRWNVSGTYMQVVPRFLSTEADGKGDAREFLRPFFPTPGALHSMVFLKGYQWPFDARRIAGGSSLIDILVYIETVLRKRRVFLDFRQEPGGFSFDGLGEEARSYLERSGARQDTPVARLRRMNPGAIALYGEHGIDLEAEPLEIAVCAQHNNGGLAAGAWWESETIARLFPVGEVNGSHGVCRPGGSALNAGQVGGLRAAEYIAARCAGRTLDPAAFDAAAAGEAARLEDWLRRPPGAARPWREEREEWQERMSRSGAHIRRAGDLASAVAAARGQWRRIEDNGPRIGRAEERREALRNRHLCFAHCVYLEAVEFSVRSGTGSRGSSMVPRPDGLEAHPGLGEEWNFEPENEAFRDRVLNTEAAGDGSTAHEWAPRRPVPEDDPWFETAWAAHREGRIYDGPGKGGGR